MADEIVRYTASDGQDVQLSVADVVRLVASGSAQPSQKDVVAFMAKCQARGLNPLAGDAYLTVYQSKDGPVSSVIVSKDYFVRTATQQETYDGMRAGVTVLNDRQLVHREGTLVLQGEQLVGGWAEVRDKRWSVPTKAEVALSEYNTGRSLWKSKPATMIRKVALVQALREAYPNAYGGVYDRDEMPEPEPQRVAATVEPAPAQPSDDDAAWLRDLTAQLVAAGYDERQCKAWLWQQWQQGGRPAVQAEVERMLKAVTDAQDAEQAGLAGDAEQQAQEQEQAVEADFYEADIEF